MMDPQRQVQVMVMEALAEAIWVGATTWAKQQRVPKLVLRLPLELLFAASNPSLALVSVTQTVQNRATAAQTTLIFVAYSAISILGTMALLTIVLLIALLQLAATMEAVVLTVLLQLVLLAMVLLIALLQLALMAVVVLTVLLQLALLMAVMRLANALAYVDLQTLQLELMESCATVTVSARFREIVVALFPNALVDESAVT